MKLQEIDITIQEILRLEVVKAGLLPDITNYTTSADYEAAKDTVLQSKGRLLEVYGVAVGESRGEVIANRITIDRVNISVGDVGSFGVVYYEKKSDNNYNKYLMPSSNVDIDYDIRLVSNLSKFDRLGQHIIFDALGTKKFISTIDTNHKCLLLMDGMFNLSSNQLLEYSFRYKVKDIYIEDSTLLSDSIKKVETISNNQQLYEEKKD